MDDKSDDGSLEDTISYLKQLNLSKNVRIVKNTKRNYATYNIINSAYNFCH